jgi:hypothetical protein
MMKAKAAVRKGRTKRAEAYRDEISIVPHSKITGVTSELGHQLPRQLADCAAAIPPEAAAPVVRLRGS